MGDPAFQAWRRPDGRIAVRNHLLVLPSVLCAALVAQDVAAAVGGVAIAHQHGCSQVGDDGQQTAHAFEGIACAPNVGAVLVVSLGCETVQGRALADRIAARGQRTEFVGIQDAGGSDGARTAGATLGQTLRTELETTPRGAASAAELVIGLEVSRPTPLAAALADRARAAGAAVLVGEASSEMGELAGDRVAAFADSGRRDGTPGDRSAAASDQAAGDRSAAPAHTTILTGAGHGAQQHAALAADGAHIIVSFPDGAQPPAGFPTCPVVAVRTASRVHDALADEFDLGPDTTADRIWQRVLEAAAGAATTAESLGAGPLALPRLAMTL
ncbi:MAG TPA: UxaA family hydrolase [Baekduia sp.]|jgi:altronate dehydratase large subunit